MIDLDELRKKAEAATQGAWIAEDRCGDWLVILEHDTYGVMYPNSVRGREAEANCKFVAAFNPEASIELLGIIEKITKENKALKACAERYLDFLNVENPKAALEKDLEDTKALLEAGE